MPTRFNQTDLNDEDEGSHQCQSVSNGFKIKVTGTISKGSLPNDYTITYDGAYITLSGEYIEAFACGDYHTANVEFDLMTSQCPSMQEMKATVSFGTPFSVTYNIHDTYIIYQELNANYTFVDSQGCEAEIPVTDSPLVTDSPPVIDDDTNGGAPLSLWIIIAVVVVVVIVVVIVVIVLVSKNKKGKRQMKVTNVLP